MEVSAFLGLSDRLTLDAADEPLLSRRLCQAPRQIASRAGLAADHW